jgi:hypothetical protein
MLKASQVQYLNLRIRAAQNRILDAQTYVLTVQKAQLREKQDSSRLVSPMALAGVKEDDLDFGL